MENKLDFYTFLTTERDKGGLKFFKKKEFSNKFKELYIEITNISFPKDFTFKQKLWHYLHDDLDLNLGTCKTCGKRCKFKSFNHGYIEHCSLSCMQNDEETKTKKKETCLEKYGVEHYNNPNKCKQTCLEKYGVKYATQSKQMQQKSKKTKLERYGDEHFTNKNKCKQTCLEKYNVECTFQTEQVKCKSKKTKLERHNNECFTNRNKYKETCLEKYGVENSFQSEISKENSKKTNLRKRNVEYATQDNTVKEKRKKTCLEKYGVDHHMKSKQFKDKTKRTNKEKYGVDWTCMRKEAKLKGNNSKPNSEFARLLEQHNIIYEREFSLGKYSFDFKVGDILIEINPTITHNSCTNPFGRNALDKEYHFKKSLFAYENNYICIHVWDWTDKEEIIQKLKTIVKVSSIGKPKLHWYHMRKKTHMINNDYDKMISEGYLPIYDDGFVLSHD